MSIASDFTSGQGGLKFVATSPPGMGRMIRIPFYMETSQSAQFNSSEPGVAAFAPGGTAVASTSSPIIIVSPVNSASVGTAITLKTPQISWATLRIVGFECIVT